MSSTDPPPPGSRPTPELLARLGSPAGLCARCRHARVLTSKTSAFLRCALSDDDPRFLKYPPLPVLRCGGWDPHP